MDPYLIIIFPDFFTLPFPNKTPSKSFGVRRVNPLGDSVTQFLWRQKKHGPLMTVVSKVLCPWKSPSSAIINHFYPFLTTIKYQPFKKPLWSIILIAILSTYINHYILIHHNPHMNHDCYGCTFSAAPGTSRPRWWPKTCWILDSTTRPLGQHWISWPRKAPGCAMAAGRWGSWEIIDPYKI